MKKIITLILALLLLASSCVGCINENGKADETTAPTTTIADTTKDSESIDTTANDTTADDTTAVDTIAPDTTEAVTEPEMIEPTETEGLIFFDYADDIISQYSKYDEIVIDNTAPANKALIYTDGAVMDLKFYSLSDPDVDENGMMTFTKTEIASHKYITSDRPLLITFTSYGDIPTYGMSVTDAVGDTEYFAFTLSGFDGSLVLTQIG